MEETMSLGIAVAFALMLLFQVRAQAQDGGAAGSEIGEAMQLTKRAVELYREGQYDSAEPLFEKALRIREKALGPEHPDVVTSLDNLGRLYEAKRDYVRAEPLYKRALRVREKTLGPEHPDVVTSLNDLGRLYKAKRDYMRAEPLYERALRIREKTLGPDHQDVAESLKPLALLYLTKSDYARAEPLVQRVLRIQEKVLGPDHPEVAESLNQLASLYKVKGDHARAESLFERALHIMSGFKALGMQLVPFGAAEAGKIFRGMGSEKDGPSVVALVVAVDWRKPAGDAFAFMRGDIITHVVLGKKAMPASPDVIRQLEEKLARGGSGRLVLVRNGTQLVVTISGASEHETKPLFALFERDQHIKSEFEALGMQLVPFSAAEAGKIFRSMGSEKDIPSVVALVVAVDRSKPVSGNFMRGDIITHVVVGKKAMPASPEIIRQLEEKLARGGSSRLVLVREEAPFVLTFAGTSERETVAAARTQGSGASERETVEHAHAKQQKAETEQWKAEAERLEAKRAKTESFSLKGGEFEGVCVSIDLEGHARRPIGTVCDPKAAANELCKELLCLRGKIEWRGSLLPLTSIQGEVSHWSRDRWQRNACRVGFQIFGGSHFEADGHRIQNQLIFATNAQINEKINEELTKCLHQIREKSPEAEPE